VSSGDEVVVDGSNLPSVTFDKLRVTKTRSLPHIYTSPSCNPCQKLDRGSAESPTQPWRARQHTELRLKYLDLDQVTQYRLNLEILTGAEHPDQVEVDLAFSTDPLLRQSSQDLNLSHPKTRLIESPKPKDLLLRVDCYRAGVS
jgi:hypothetical protein